MALVFYILIAVTVGISGGAQVLVNSNLNRTADLTLTTLVVNLTATAGAIIIYLAVSRQSFGVLKNADWYAFLGGILGLIIVMGSTFLIPKLGITMASSVIIVSQLSFAMVADHFGLLGIRHIPVDPTRAVALVLMIIGIYLFFK